MENKGATFRKNKHYKVFFLTFWKNRGWECMILWKVWLIFFVCLSLKFFLFPLVAHQVKSNLHTLLCVYIKNTYTTCSCFHTCDALHPGCSSETQKNCLVSLTYHQRGHHYADSVIHWSLFGAHTEGMQCELWSVEILFHALPYRRWTMESLL